ncbi:MAG: TrkA family potassium uptake protein [Lachnospiraceae bacterium]|nr:TrkA family potassium uptake protein [Lachnospiraceae bacterium]
MGKSVAVLGLGKYGRSLAEHLYDAGADVLAVDKNKDLIADIADKCTTAVCANLTDEDAVMALGLQNMDIVVSAIGSNLAASIMAVAVAKEQGVPLVVAKSSSERMSSLLKKVGADKVIDPEGEGGERSARILQSMSFRDFFKLDDNMYLIETNPKNEWIGKTLVELELRQTMNLNVIAVKEKGMHWHFIDPQSPIVEGCQLLIAMEKKKRI